MKLHPLITALVFSSWLCTTVTAQDTFSIVAVDSVTGEVGSAGASCVDLIQFFPTFSTDFIGDLIPGTGAINTQASYNATNQSNARARMLAGDTPAQIVAWLSTNDAQGSSASRQYGVAALINGSPQAAGFTGTNCVNYKNHITGPNYSIQGNILLNQAILDSMEARFLNEPGDLACKLMAAMQGAKVVGADTRCNSNGTSSLFAFLKVAQPTDPVGSPSLLAAVKTLSNSGIEPIDSLQNLLDAVKNCSITAMPILSSGSMQIYPNPVQDMVYIRMEGESQVTSYCLMDVNGRIVLSGAGLPTELDLRALVQGVYILELSGPIVKTYHKIVRQ